MNDWIVNRHGRLVFPGNFFPRLDFSVFDTLEQFETVIRRDFEDKTRTEGDIIARCDATAYGSRYELLRDLAHHLFAANRYALTMYVKRPTRWRDVPRRSGDVFLPVVKRADAGDLIAVIEPSYRTLRSNWDESTEDKAFGILLDVLRKRKGIDSQAIGATVAQALADPGHLVYRLGPYDPDYPGYSYADIVGFQHAVPELESLVRHAMVLHNQSLWDSEAVRLAPIGGLRADDVVVLYVPRDAAVRDFIRRVQDSPLPRPYEAAPVESHWPLTPVPPVVLRRRARVMPRLEGLGVYKGERACTNDDLVRNSAYCWSPMTADDIRRKTGIERRLYTALDVTQMSLLAARAALAKARRGPDEIAGVLFCSCTSGMTMPSVSTWLSGQLGMRQTHASYDIVAACAGLPYGLAEAVRLLEETGRPILVVAGEKFSDKIGVVRTSRMLFGDGAAALVVGPAPPEVAPDIELFQTYASGPMSEVNSIIWPNAAYDNKVTVYGPEVRALVKRYLEQMIGELKALPAPPGRHGSFLDAIDLVIPHQANKTMVTELAQAAGLAPDRLYFNIDRVGNTSAASIPIAIVDAVRDGVIDRPMRVFAPGFGAGAVAGYVVMRVDPAIVA
jgi:3-oxoacyl-(acyl-carrier-protein) synthase III